MIINLTGPPGVGKSTFASRFVLQHPEWKYCPIDQYRRDSINEDQAWVAFRKDLLHNKKVVVESCGLNHKLHTILAALRRPTLSIFMSGPYDLIEERLKARQEQYPLPDRYNPKDELLALKWVTENHDKYPYKIDVRYNIQSNNPDRIYSDLYKQVTQFLVRDHSGQKLKETIHYSRNQSRKLIW